MSKLLSDAEDRLYLRSISYAIRGTNAVQNLTNGLLGSAMLNVSLSGKFSNISFDGRKAQSGLSHYPATADAWMGFDGIVGSFNLDVGII